MPRGPGILTSRNTFAMFIPHGGFSPKVAQPFYSLCGKVYMHAMRLKALRPLTAMSSLATPPSSQPARPAAQARTVQPRFWAASYANAALRPPGDESEEPVVPLPPFKRPRADGAAAPLPPSPEPAPPPRGGRRRRHTPPRYAPNQATSQALKLLGGLTALVGAWHAAPAIHDQWHAHRHGRGHKHGHDESHSHAGRGIDLDVQTPGPTPPYAGRDSLG